MLRAASSRNRHTGPAASAGGGVMRRCPGPLAILSCCAIRSSRPRRPASAECWACACAADFRSSARAPGRDFLHLAGGLQSPARASMKPIRRRPASPTWPCAGSGFNRERRNSGKEAAAHRTGSGGLREGGRRPPVLGRCARSVAIPATVAGGHRWGDSPAGRARRWTGVMAGAVAGTDRTSGGCAGRARVVRWRHRTGWGPMATGRLSPPSKRGSRRQLRRLSVRPPP